MDACDSFIRKAGEYDLCIIYYRRLIYKCSKSALKE